MSDRLILNLAIWKSNVRLQNYWGKLKQKTSCECSYKQIENHDNLLWRNPVPYVIIVNIDFIQIGSKTNCQCSNVACIPHKQFEIIAL